LSQNNTNTARRSSEEKLAAAAHNWLHDDWPQVETSPNWNLMTVQRRKRLSSVSKEIVASREPKKEQRLF
jgi:hypothetical protein